MSKILHLPTLNASTVKIKRRVKEVLKSPAYNLHTHTHVGLYVLRYTDKYIDDIEQTECILRFNKLDT